MNNRVILTISNSYNRILRAEGFSVYEIKNGMNAIASINDQGLYKICLFTGSDIHPRDVKEKGRQCAVLVFEKPYLSHSLNSTLKVQQGFACFFTESFLKNSFGSACIQPFRMSDIESSCICFLNPEQKDFVAFLFRRMMMEQNTAYVFKKELLCNYLHLLLHEASKRQTMLRLN
jgi:AraC family transcriptional regulator, transcriptional activator of pobA